MKKFGLLFVFLAAASIFFGCAGQQPAAAADKMQAVTFRLNYTAQGSHAPIFYGLKQGIFEKHGIALTVGEGKGSGSTVNLVATGGDMFGWADAGTTFNLISQGATVKVIAPGYTRMSLAVISISKNNITKPEDIVGKKLGYTEGDGPSKLLPAFLKNIGVDADKFEMVAMDVTGKVPSLLTGKVDAILGGYDDQPFAIEAQGFTPTVIAYADHGVNMIGMSFIANDKTIKEDPALVTAFVSAAAESWAAAYKDPEGAMEALIAQFPDLNKTTVGNQLQAAFGCLISEYSNGLMNASQDLYDQTIAICKQYMGLPEETSPKDLYTRDFVPKQVYSLEK